MLTLYHGGEQYPLDNTEYYIRELANGLDEVIFSLPIHHPIYAILAEEENIVDRAGQTYKVKQIDAGARDAKVVCQLDIDEWRATLNVEYNSGTKTVVQQIEAVKPTGWTVLDRSSINIGRTIEGDLTPYDVCVECTNIYSVYVRWDNKIKTCTIYPKAMGTPVGAFATRELNLKEINYKGKSNDLVTRLYAYGKDGLSFADINSGKAYVDNFTYTNKIICGIWRDDRYEVAQNLLDDATTKLAQMAKPVRSYECSIVDLQATNPSLYNNLDFSLFTAATLIDDVKENAVNYQVVERHIYPYHPDKNEVVFNSEPLKITASVVSIANEIENPNSTFSQIQAERIKYATNWLLSGDGYVVAVKGADGEWKELLFMDDNDMALAQKVLRINENGIGFSTNGVNGPYTNAWTIDGQLVADFITTGTMSANRIRGGVLELGGFNNEDGVLLAYANGAVTSGAYSGSNIDIPIGYTQIGTVATVPIDVIISNISNLADYGGAYTLFYTSDGGATWSNLESGSLNDGSNRLNTQLNIVNNSNVYYTLRIKQVTGKTATFDYAIKKNLAVTRIDASGIDTTNGNFKGTINGSTISGSTISGSTITSEGTGTGTSATISGGSVVIVADANNYLKIEGGGETTTFGPNISVNGDIYVQERPTYLGWAIYDAKQAHSSDIKLKKNVEDIPISDSRKIIQGARPRYYEFKETLEKGTRSGLIAQELREALDSIGNDTAIERESIRREGEREIIYEDFIAHLINCIKDLYAEIDSLKGVVNG